MHVQTKPAEDKTAETPVTKSQRQSHQSRQPRRLNPKNKRNSQKNRQLPNKSRLKSRLKSRQNRNRQSRPSRHSMSALMLSYAKEYAVSIGLSLDSTATECWDNPISANPNRSGIKSDIESRLNRYKNSEGFTAVWIWTEKLSDTEYNIYIGY
ncbi:Signal recognition particle-docking protein FtsY [gut metagenome]|uniref:Signal recognition particle-docking protein FtsY n=1 Tax=gut metagenome TaxID=749906 RepID=J9FYR0_9ZZZZ